MGIVVKSSGYPLQNKSVFLKKKIFYKLQIYSITNK